METFAAISPGHAGILIWVVWGLIGLFEGLVAARVLGGKRIVFLDCVVGIVAAGLGGILSTCFLGETPMMLFLISIVAAIFFSALILWLVGAIFFRDSEEMNQ